MVHAAPGEGKLGAGHAGSADARRVEGRDEVAVHVRPDVVVLVLKGRPRGVDDEGGENRDRDQRLDPPAILTKGRLVGTSASTP